MLYTANASALERRGKPTRAIYVVKGHGNDAVVPDQQNLDQYRSGALTWTGFRVDYLAKLTKPEAGEWMERVSVEAASQDVVLVSDESDAVHSYRRLLADMIANMFSGQRNLRYLGELEQSGSG